MKKNLLVITTIFPNPLNMTAGSYNREIISELSEYYNIDVIVPIPWTQCLRTGKPKDWVLNKARVHHPIFYYPPGFLHRTHDYFYFLSISRLIRQLISCTAFSAVLGMWLYPDCRVVKRVAHDLSVPYYVKVLGTDVNRLDLKHPLFPQSMEVLQDASRIICVSEGLKNRLVSLGVSPEKLFVLLNGVNKSIFLPCSIEIARQKLELPIKQEIILFVGNLKREKGLGELISAFSIIKNNPSHSEAVLCLIGEGPFERELRQLIIHHGMSDSVRFLGRQAPLDVAMWMNAANLLCLPSYSEGMPNVVLEALSCHTHVVATSIDGINELACLDDRIIVVPPREFVALSEAINSALEKYNKSPGKLIIYSWADFANTVFKLIS